MKDSLGKLSFHWNKHFCHTSCNQGNHVLVLNILSYTGQNYWTLIGWDKAHVRDSLRSRAPPYPPRVGHVILKTMCSSQFVCAKRLRKFGCFDRFTFVYLPSILDMRPEDAQKICKSSFVRIFVLFFFVIRFPLVQVASFAFCNFQLYRLRLRLRLRRLCRRLNIKHLSVPKVCLVDLFNSAFFLNHEGTFW